jgi:ATP-dependent RNA helicase SUPV3L1/SUV3
LDLEASPELSPVADALGSSPERAAVLDATPPAAEPLDPADADTTERSSTEQRSTEPDILAAAEATSAEQTEAIPIEAAAPVAAAEPDAAISAAEQNTPAADAVLAPLPEVPPTEPIAAEASKTAPEPSIEAGEVAAATATEELVEVWRPGRSGAQRHRRSAHAGQGDRRRKQRPAQAPAADVTPPAGEGTSPAVEPTPSLDADRVAKEQRRPREFRAGGPDREKRHRDRPQPPHRPAPPEGRAAQARGSISEHSGRPARRDRPERRDRGDRPDRDPELRAKYIKGRNDDDRRDKLPDPNSPFAKLAALKAQLEADSKERR